MYDKYNLGGFIMDSNNLIDTSELADLLNQLDASDFKELDQTGMSDEMQASNRRYEEIIKKHEK